MKLFSWSWSLGRLRGVDIRFHFSLLFSIPIAYYLFMPVDVRGVVESLLWVGGFLLFILLHELGHTFAAQLVGVEVKSVVVWLLGGFTRLAYKPEKPLHNLLIAMAGPLANMLLAFLCVLFYVGLTLLSRFYSDQVGTFLWIQTFQNLCFSLAVVNLLLIVFNLLPVYPLDGGNILHAAMELFFGKSNADWITLVVGIPFLLLLIMFGLFTRDYILLGFCLVIAFSISTLNRSILRWLNLSVNYVFKRAGYYYLLTDYDRAIKFYTRDIEKKPEHPGNYLGRASCYLLLAQKERALADVDRALKITPTHALGLQLRGEIYMLEKDHDAALEIFSRTQAMNPHWSVPYFDRASILLDRHEFGAALDDLNKAVALQSRMSLYYLVRSLAYFRLGDVQAAHKDMDQAVQIAPQESLVMFDINLTLYEDNLDWAKDFYERILARIPRNALALQGYADACRVNREFSQAEALYTRALAINPKEPRLYLGRGKTYLELNEVEKAKMDFEKVLSISDKQHLKRQTETLLKTLATL
jgi:tetratricopeptide (TPR) repeat protein